MAKVYCENCLFFLPGENIPFSFGPPPHQLEKCLSPENFKGTHAEPLRLPKSQPKVINRFNNCRWFEFKPDNPSSCSSCSSCSSAT